MKELNFWEFPPDIRIYLDDEVNSKYWESVEEKAGSLAETARILSKRLDKKIYTENLCRIKKRYKTYKKTQSEVRFPVKYLRILKEELGIDYKDLQNHIESYSTGKRNKVIPEIDGERKLPIEFDEELIVFLSAGMWNERQPNLYTFDGKAEQIESMYNTFRDHFGKIPKCEKTRERWDVYPISKAVTYIGLNYIDQNMSNFKKRELLAVFLGSYAAKGAHHIKSKGMTICSKKPEPLVKLKTALDKLGFGFNEREYPRHNTIYFPQINAHNIYSDTKKFCKKHDVGPFLDSTLEHFKKCAEISRN
jgi:hypothetical protein